MTAGRRRALKKTKGKEGFCWAWKKDHKARGVAAEKRKDWEAAETHRCHRQPQGETRRCYLHGGTAKSGKAHHSYKHGFYSNRHQGILARAGEAHEALEVMASSHDELAVHKALIDHKLGEVLAAGPSDEAWAELRGLVQQIDTARQANDRKAQAALLNTLFDAIRLQSSSAAARREASDLIEKHSRVVDRESKRQERQAAVVNVNAFFGFVDMLTAQVNIHVSDPAERAAVGKAFSDAVARAGLPGLVNDTGAEPTRH